MIKIYFTCEGTTVTLPVNPPQLQITKKGKNKKEEIVKLGQINLLRSPDLAEIKIESFFPTASNAPYVITQSDFREPSYYIEFFERARTEKKPLEFAVAGADTGLSDSKPLVSIEDFTYRREGGDPDVYYTLGLMEYKPFQSYAGEVNVVSTDTGTAAVEMAQQREVSKAVPSTYTVVSGDSLWAIAQRHLGNGNRYTEIAALNSIADASKIYAGQVLTLPA